MSSLQRFIDWFEEYYSHEFPDLSREQKGHWIEEVLKNNSLYIDKSDVANFDGCVMCGRCCKKQGCPHVTEDGLCERHDNPIDQLCIDYPWTGDDFGIAPLDLGCRFQISFFIHFFDRFFKEEVENKKYCDFIGQISREVLE